MSPAQVMIVEDNSVVAEDCRCCLESLNYNVTSITASAEESIDMVEAEQPDIILMDIRLRDKMDGIEAAKHIHKHFGTPIVFLSSYSDPELIDRAKKAGSFGYLVKPFDQRELNATLEMALSKAAEEKKSIHTKNMLLKNEKKLEKSNKEFEEIVKKSTSSLKDMNTALNVLLKKQKDDQNQINDNIFTNFQSLIKPLLKQMQGTLTQNTQKRILDVLESSIMEMASPFSKKLSDPIINLTPTEIKVANLIKRGKKNREIANILHSSLHTIAQHRQNIRKKTGLQNKKTNLQSFLSNIKE